jgi:hypothetical protein
MVGWARSRRNSWKPARKMASIPQTGSFWRLMRAYRDARSMPDQKSSSNWSPARRAEASTRCFLTITHHEPSETNASASMMNCTIRLALAIKLQNDIS